MKYFFKNNEKGQTTVEYILLLAVVVIMGVGVGKQIRNQMLGDGDCPNESLICTLLGQYSGNGFLDGNFRNFTLRR